MKHQTPDEIIIAGFLPWVEQQPANKTYNYGAISNCAFAQYLRATGAALNPVVGSCTWDDLADCRQPSHLLPDKIDAAVRGQVDADGLFEADLSFGGLAQRLRELA